MLGIRTLGGTTRTAVGSNAHGQIVGDSSLATGEMHAFVYDSISGMQDLGADGFQSLARDINEQGIIIGGIEQTPGNWRAAIFDELSGPTLLQDLIPADSGWLRLNRATDINDLGQIVGTGIINGEQHAFLLTPIPEPISLVLDIKPGSDENPVNLKSRGVLPVAVLSTDDFDASDIDVETLLFGDPLLLDNGATAAGPLRYAFEDVSDDGLVDLTLKFSIPELVDFGALGPESTAGLLTGALFDGTAIEGADSIRIVPSNGTHVTSLQASGTPEPATLALALLGTAVLLATRRDWRIVSSRSFSVCHSSAIWKNIHHGE